MKQSQFLYSYEVNMKKIFLFIVLIIFLSNSPVIAQDTQTDNKEIEDNYFEKIYPKFRDYEVMRFRDDFFNCGNSDQKRSTIDCQSRDTLLAIKLLMETARMNGYLRACGSNEWYLYFGHVTHRIKPIFSNEESEDISAGVYHGIIQGTYTRETEEKNQCDDIPKNEDRIEWLKLQAMFFFNSRLLPLEQQISFPNPEYPKELIEQMKNQESEQNKQKQ